MNKTVDILYVTYLHDLEWFQWSLNSVKKNFSGHRKIVGVAPLQDAWLFSKIQGVEWHFIPDWVGRGYFWQQWVKIQAWKYSDADYICHIDSDVMVLGKVSVEELFRADKPCWMWQKYEELPPNVPWQPITEQLLGDKVALEYMRAFPFIIDRRTHELTEQHLVKRFKQSLEHIIRSSRGFSEFNIMGAIAHKFQEDLYTWFNTGNGGHWPVEFRLFRQHWSHDDWNKAQAELVQEFGAIPILTDFGVWVVPGDTHLSAWIREHRRLDFDIYFLEQIAKFIKGDDVVVDVGAFVGDHTMAYANLASGGCVYAFEPNEVVFKALVENMRPYLHVKPIQAGLSDRMSKAQASQDPNWGGVYLQESAEGDTRTMTLDSMELGRLDFMKIDAEGFEVRVLRGARETIQRCRPILVIEVNKGALERQGTSEQELRKVLDDLGYEIFEDSMGLQYDIFCRPKQS